mgnify:CR=1 FL=1
MAATAARAETSIFEVDEGQNTLGDYRHKRKYKAEDGQEGGEKSAATVPTVPTLY